MSHERVAVMAVRRIPPFKKRAKYVTGYRDALVWFTVLEELPRSSTPLILVAGDGDLREHNEIRRALRFVAGVTSRVRCASSSCG